MEQSVDAFIAEWLGELTLATKSGFVSRPEIRHLVFHFLVPLFFSQLRKLEL